MFFLAYTFSFVHFLFLFLPARTPQVFDFRDKMRFGGILLLNVLIVFKPARTPQALYFRDKMRVLGYTLFFFVFDFV